MRNNLISLALVPLMAISLASCEKTFELGDELNPLPIQQEAGQKIAVLRKAYPNDFVKGIKLMQTPEKILVEEEQLVSVDVRLTELATKDVEATVSIVTDQEAMKAFAKQEGLDEKTISLAPKGAFKLLNDKLIIKKGEQIAEATLVLADEEILKGAADGKFYLALTVKAEGMPTSSNYGIFKVLLEKKTLKVKPIAEANLTGFTKLDASKFTYSPKDAGNLGRYPYTNAFDGSLENFWLTLPTSANEEDQRFQILFDETKELAGLRVGVNQQFSWAQMNKAEVFYLDEKDVWHSLFDYSAAVDEAKDGFINIELYKSTVCKGIKIVPEKTKYSLFSELEFYAK